MSKDNPFRHFYPVDAPKAADSKHYPFIDVDNNGVIIVTPFDMVGHRNDRLVFMNISRQFTGEGLRMANPEYNIVFDFENKINDQLSVESVQNVVGFIEKLYTNEIDSLNLKNLPGMTYDILGENDMTEHVAVQWDRKDFDRLIEHIRAMYDPTFTKH